MADLKTVAAGLNILLKYRPDADVEGHHDIINVCVREDDVTDAADRERLEALGFHIDADADGTYAHYT